MSFIVDPKIEDYAGEHTSPAPELLRELERKTLETMEMPQMLTGGVEARFLKLFVQAINARRVLEIGMFTGYATLSMAEGLPEEGRVLTCELNPKAIQFASDFFARSPHGKKIEILEGSTVTSLKSLKPPFDFIFVDADKVSYPIYYEESLRLLRPGGFIALDNMLYSGEVLNPKDESPRVLNQLNEKISRDSRVEAVLLTVRDGIQLVRKV